MLKTEFLLTTADEIRTFYTLSPPLELCSAARGQGSRVTLGETDSCELSSPREGDVGVCPILSPLLAIKVGIQQSSMQLNVLCCSLRSACRVQWKLAFALPHTCTHGHKQARTSANQLKAGYLSRYNLVLDTQNARALNQASAIKIGLGRKLSPSQFMPNTN